jgi:hypothetical protein
MRKLGFWSFVRTASVKLLIVLLLLLCGVQ